ncbi:platelet basic protein [Echinops telfairi]|uniref:C-X-C motif chemokine n=1 Tax=Echinops telfairi TaxID=9371 RepID=A0ABM0IMF5_ECHTE|nr:platelet basic protein [Echinops telfairi]
MSLRHNTASSCTGVNPFGTLQVSLLLALLLTALIPCASRQISNEEDSLNIELRCTCVKTISGIQPSYIKNLQVIRSGPHCHKVEVIAILKDGRKICLNPEDPRILKIVQKILEDAGPAA